MPNVAFTRLELRRLKDVYETVEDCCEGDFQVKKRKVKYLPKPNASDTSPENKARYEGYLNRAMFFNATKNTYNALVGMIFAKPAEIDIPDSLRGMIDNCDGEGKSLIQHAKDSVGSVLKTSRIGLLVDFPSDGEETTMHPVIKMYDSKDIINWRTVAVGTEKLFTVIVLREKEIYLDDGFEFLERDFYRVLKLVNGVYVQDIYSGDDVSFEVPSKSIVPTKFDGSYFDRIPFEFCGSDNNDALPDVPPLYDISVANIAHYRNSADYEDSCFITGQPTPYFAGLTEEWVRDVLKGSIQLGSRAAVALPEGASAGLLQANPNTMPFEAMKHKEELMVMLGAKLVSPNSSTRTATESAANTAGETSVLSNIANNVSEAFTRAFGHASSFVTDAEPEVVFALNTDFEISKISVTERAQIVNEWMRGLISFSEARVILKNGKIPIGDDEAAKSEIDADMEASAALDAANTNTNTSDNTNV